MNDQKKLWEGDFGTEYAVRNKLDDDFMRPRIMFWENMMKNIYFVANSLPTSILEVGAGTGANLMAINAIYKHQLEGLIDPMYKLYATEVNVPSRDALIVNVPNVNVLADPDLNNYEGGQKELVYTSGVLIHTHPDKRMELMRPMFSISKRYIVCIEYFAPETRAIPYRGNNDQLWLDDYGSIWLDNFPLRLISYGFMWKKVTGLDNVTYWLFEKTNGVMH